MLVGMRTRGFLMTAMAGGAIATAVIASGMALTIERLDDLAAEQISRLRAEEEQITLAERLRFIGEVLVSAGRDYVITGEAVLRQKLVEAGTEFDRIDEQLRDAQLAARLLPESTALIDDVESDARTLLEAQEALLSDKNRPGTADALRAEELLLPLQDELGRSLDRLVEAKESALDTIYAQAAKERSRLALWLYGSVAALLLLGLGVTWYFARQASRAYAKEQQAREVARAAAAARDELVGMLAHDLRNPLGAILMYAGHIAASGDGASRQGAASIERIAEEMASLIKSMLDVTMLEAGRFPVVIGRCSADRLVQESFDMLEALAVRRGVALLYAPQGDDLMIEADRNRVLQLLSNIVGNAIKFTPSGGRVAVSIEPYGETVRFAIADDGPGISPEHLPHVFDRFWHKEGPGSPGTGLGLFICKKIVEAHGGEIWVESAPGHGATFFFTLPRASAASATNELRYSGASLAPH